MQNTVQMLKKMRNILKSRGWVKGTLVDRTGKVCLLGAWGIASGNIYPKENGGWRVPTPIGSLINDADEGKALFEALYPPKREKLDVHNPGELYRFNDRTDITEEDVMDLVDKAIERVERQGQPA